MAMKKPKSWRSDVRKNWQKASRGWKEWEAWILHTLAAVDPVLMRHLQVETGDKILDLACGTGEPALSLAKLVGPRGQVLAIDDSSAMLQAARERARTRKIKNVRFLRGDLAGLGAITTRFDGVCCRFGLFFAEDVDQALQGIRKRLKPGARAVFAIWAPLEKNEWWRIRTKAMEPFIAEGVDGAASPNPMRMAPKGHLARLLKRAGYKRVSTEGVAVPFVCSTPEDFWNITVATSASLLKLLGELSAGSRNKIRVAILRGLKRHQKGDTVVVPGMAWVVSGEK